MNAERWGRITEAASFVSQHIATPPRVALVLGSGLGALADEMSSRIEISYRDIPNFPRSTAPGHAGKLVTGTLAGQDVMAMVGRVHLYEGYGPSEVAFGVRVMRAVGARELVITNAAGGINLSYEPGFLMLISDHINLTGVNPLVGPNNPTLGKRFPDMSEAYSLRLRALARESARASSIDLVEGVYMGLLGPNYETPAEIRMARKMGADAIGMSTVVEVIAARHMGMEVLGVSCITNMAAGILPQTLTEEEVLQTATTVQSKFSRLIRGVLEGTKT
ncbi:MAG: purine-nucleoside phosphorylase [Chloroflexota bacterium]